MCDTLVALGNSTKDGVVILGKNSDRPPNEAQVLRRFPGAKHPSGSVVKCTYIEIPQASQTFEVILSCPFWMWGAEMGVNEHGVAIGNEAVWSKENYADTGLLGMDLLRLGLERGSTAREALDLIVELLQKYGQGGDCFYGASMKYHNSYIIADTQEAWILETAGKYWVAERVDNLRSISNGYTIGKHWDLASADLIKHAVDMGWCQSEREFDFAQCYGDIGMREIVHCVERVDCTRKLMMADKGNITVSHMMSYLRNHGGYALSEWNPDKQLNTVCMHAGPEVISQSTASYVGYLSWMFCENWFTIGSSPCISTYIPVYLGYAIPQLLTEGAENYQSNSYWWIHEKLVRLVQEEYPGRASVLDPAVAELQTKFFKEVDEVRKNIPKLSVNMKGQSLTNLTNRCTEIAVKKIAEWLQLVQKVKPTSHTKESYLNFVREINKSSGIEKMN
jgi:dipeptidase